MSFKDYLKEAAVKWEKTTAQSFGDDVEDYLPLLDKISKKELGKGLYSTFTTDSESTSILLQIWKDSDKRKIDDEFIGYGTYKFKINDVDVLGSNWDGIIWIISAKKFNF